MLYKTQQQCRLNGNSMNTYTGIGSRNTPSNILRIMADVAELMADEKYVLRSGGANGADLCFEQSCDILHGDKDIFLPWKGFNNSKSDKFLAEYDNIPDEAKQIAKDAYGPRWDVISSNIKRFMIRNVYQVLNEDLKSPSDFVVCWTPDGCEKHEDRTKNTGGTGQAISIASLNNIPVFNLAKIKSRQFIETSILLGEIVI